MSKIIELADAYAQSRANNPAPHSASEARAALVAEVEKLERDAARYRWLRDSKIEDDAQEWLCVGLFDMCGVVEVDGKELDFSIDAAMEATNGQGN